MKNINKQHTLLPNNMEVKAKDQLVYVVIKSFQNKELKEANKLPEITL